MNLVDPIIYQALNDMPIIIVIEEITSVYDAHWAQSTIKSFLDGELSWENTITIATTNYPEQLPNELMNRPARFDKMYIVENPDAQTRRIYLKKLLKESYEETLIELTKGLSLAYLRELAVASRIYNRSFESILKEFAERINLVKNGLQVDPLLQKDSNEIKEK
jgi:SpoVK/Ycf46/Vps4 family AAA+-type ATPase